MGAVVVLPAKLFAQVLEFGVMGKRPITRHPQLSGGVSGVQLGIAGHCAAGHKLRACSAVTQIYVMHEPHYFSLVGVLSVLEAQHTDQLGHPR